MRNFLSALIVTLSALNIFGIVELPDFPAFGIFLVAVLIVMDRIFAKPAEAAPKDKS